MSPLWRDSHFTRTRGSVYAKAAGRGVSFEMNGLLIMTLVRSCLLFSAAAALSASAVAQRAPPVQPRAVAPAPQGAAGAPVPQGAAGAPVPGNPDFSPQTGQLVPRPCPPPLPPAMWDPVSVQDLVYYIQQVGKEGLNPADYDPAGLAAALRLTDPMTVSREATDRFNRLSSDLALGHVKKGARIAWFRRRQ